MSRGGHTGLGMTAEALGEKADMQHLNNKLAEYIDRVQALKKSAALGLDPRDYQESMKQLENEVLKLKQLYEDEITKLRQKLGEANRKVTSLGAENDKNVALNNKLMEQVNRAKVLENDNAALQGALVKADQVVAALQDKLKQLDTEAANGQKWRQENDNLRKQLSEEVKRRQEAEAASRHARDKIDFDSRVHGQQVKELEERVKAQNDIIAALEKRLKTMAMSDGNMPATLQKLREANQAEMKKFQKETEDGLGRNMDALKQQIENDRKAKDQLNKEMKQLEDTLRNVAVRNNDLESQNKGLQSANHALKNENEIDRARAQQTIADLEKRLTELHDQLMSHSKEFVNARDAQASLRSEIETYRTLLNEESNKLESRQGSRGPASQRPAPTYGKSQASGLPNIPQSKTMQPSATSGYNAFATTYKLDYTSKQRLY